MSSAVAPPFQPMPFDGVDPAADPTVAVWERAFPDPALRSRLAKGAILTAIGQPLTTIGVCLRGQLLVSGRMAGAVVPVELVGRGYVAGLESLCPLSEPASPMVVQTGGVAQTGAVPQAGAGQRVGCHLWQVRAVTAVDMLMVPRSQVMAALAADPLLGLTAMAGLTRRLHGGLAAVDALKHVSARLRLARYLLSVLESGSRVLPLPKKDIAALLGVTQQSLSRLLRDLRSDGVDVQGGTIRCPDREQLRRLCDPEELWSDKDFADAGK